MKGFTDDESCQCDLARNLFIKIVNIDVNDIVRDMILWL
jgi:hypothetical protein